MTHADRYARRQRPWLTILAVSVALCLPLILRTRASAHSFAPALLLLDEQTPGIFAMTWRLSDATAVGGDAASPPLAPRLPSQCQRMTTADQPGSPSTTLVDCGPAGLRGAIISVDGLEASLGDVILRISWIDGDSASGVLHRTHNTFPVPGRGAAADGASARQVLHRYFALGTQYIFFGFDHVLFVLGLMLLVTNTPSLIKTISAFTLAHSATLALATFGVVRVPPAPVALLIALSIVVLAIDVARRETGYSTAPTVARQYPWLVAFAFGLLHGLAYAGALAELGLPANQMPLGLLAFNLGVEAGQLALVLTLGGCAWAWARLGAPERWLRVVPAYTMGALAVVWTLERLQQFWLPLWS